ncbi:MAG: glycosyltransferase family 39 protein [Luteolibacter sp.]
MSNSATKTDTGILIRRILFFVLLLILTLGNLFVFFRGLSSPQAMDQAQISREIARGHGFSTKMIRPMAYVQAQKAQNTTISMVNFPDTYHSPLNPWINAAVIKLVGADDAAAWQMSEKEMVYPLDRVIATVSTLFFLMAIGVNYLLISRIFDAKIAGVSALLMLLCQTFWEYALSGLPQMLMLLLFSSGLYFAYRAVEETKEGRLSLVPGILAGVFFTLLALTHWLTVWIALGYIIFAAVSFRPRAITGVAVLVLIILAAVGPIIRNQTITGSPFGTAFLALYNGLGNGTEQIVMRGNDLNTNLLDLNGLVLRVASMTLMQFSDIVRLLGGLVVAPLFFVALLHPFRRPAIASFRWLVAAMWLSAAFGLSFFGLAKEGLDPNQLHLLFAPIMAAYGLAFVSILWNRLDQFQSIPMLKNAHLIVIVLFCAAPMLLALPNQVRGGLTFRDRGGIPNWPPYYAPALNSKESGLKRYVSEKQVIFADQPWATAWYADRISLWLPVTRGGFEQLETAAADLETPVSGILISPVSHGSGPMRDLAQTYKDFVPFVIDGRVTLATLPQGFSIFDKDPKTADIAKRYAFRIPLVSLDMAFYRDSPPSAAAPSDN